MTAQAALAQRLGAAAGVLLTGRPALEGSDRDEDLSPAAAATKLLTELLDEVKQSLDPAAIWLLLASVAAAIPEPDEVAAAARAIELLDSDEAAIWLLAHCLTTSIESGDPERTIRIVERGVLIDVSHSAQNVLQTGIQQVVRNTVPIWAAEHDVVLTAWDQQPGILRELTESERSRVLFWGSHADPRQDNPSQAADAPLTIPWQSSVILLEVPSQEACRRHAGLAQFSNNELHILGYDCIPVVSADLLLPVEPSRFVHYLTAVKHARTVAGISSSATAEFAGFVTALPTQGLAGPAVTSCLLPVQPLADQAISSDSAPNKQAIPLVLCVGSHEPRKNHLAVLFAAEYLWREGREFELMFIGGSGFGTRLADQASLLQDLGRPITIIRKASDDILIDAYTRARFTMFPSLHEGYGLPVAESMAYGTPVITSNFGSMAELLAHGGGLAVDSRDDLAILDAMRSLLTDDALLARLQAELASIPGRSWQQFADELWQIFVEQPVPSSAQGLESARTVGV